MAYSSSFRSNAYKPRELTWMGIDRFKKGTVQHSLTSVDRGSDGSKQCVRQQERSHTWNNGYFQLQLTDWNN